MIVLLNMYQLAVPIPTTIAGNDVEMEMDGLRSSSTVAMHGSEGSFAAGEERVHDDGNHDQGFSSSVIPWLSVSFRVQQFKCSWFCKLLGLDQAFNLFLVQGLSESYTGYWQAGI